MTNGATFSNAIIPESKAKPLALVSLPTCSE